MAVFERTYKPYAGALSPEWSRFLIIPRHAVRDIFRSKLFTAFYALSFVWPLICAILIYLRHNVEALAILRLSIANVIPIDATFFMAFVQVQGIIGFFLALLVGPQQVSRDLTNNALPLYLCRPFSRTEYVIGKMSIVIIMLSTISWLPGLILFLLQSYLEGWTWFWENIPIASAIFLGSLVWILLLALLTQTISAWVRWKVASRAALVGLFLIPGVFTAIVNEIFQTHWGNLFNLQSVMQKFWGGPVGPVSGQTAGIGGMANGPHPNQNLSD